MAMFGLVFLAGYIVSRAASFHHFDTALSMKLNGVRILTLVEPLGIVIVIAGAFRFMGSKAKR
ncbi:MAG: hypothetical protein KTR18_07775 [Acidiferrobacterales bacterium]|nr:hypothetical protein [Acidiferrobacterales bacterium]